MQTVDVCRRESGKIWHRKPVPNSNGLLVSITNTVSSSLSVQSRNVRFLHAAFDISGDSFIAGDYQGNVYQFNLHRNKFSLVKRLGGPCTALAFQLRRRSEFLAALSDFSLKCFDTDTKELVASMIGHSSVIHTISVHSSGRYALTSSPDTAQLWDLDTFQRKRKLNVKENVGITKVFFLPMSNTIITCFKDDTIFAWESDTLACKYQLHVPDGKAPGFKAFAASRDGRQLVAGGKSRYLHLWSLDTRKLLQIVELPKKITCVKHLEFLPDSFDVGSNQILGILAQDGIVRFINLSTCKQLFDIGSLEERVNSVAFSPTGRHLVAVMDSGNVHVYCVQALSAEVNKPPAPLVKVLKFNKMADTTMSSAANSTQASRATQPRSAKPAKASTLPGTEDSSDTSDMPGKLDADRLYAILKGYGEYPAKYRMFIWRCLLQLPENHAAYGALVDKGTHPAFTNLHLKYPIKSRKLLRVLQRVLSALAHWSPIFGETDYLPMLAFPFVKLFQNNQLLAFEVTAAVLTNWCSHWFEYFPNPPINQLGLVENVLAHHDKELLSHLVRHNVTSQVYAWPLLETLFSEVLTRDEWLRLFDNVFSNHPGFLPVVAAAYCITNRGPLLKCVELDDFKYFFHHRNAVDVGQVLKEAYRLMDTTPEDIHPQHAVEGYCALTKGQYPVFNKYPKFIVDYQIQERDRIRQEEEEYLRQRQASVEQQQEAQRRVGEEEAWYRQQKLLLEAEDRRRKVIAEEEQKLADQRTRLAAMNRELKMKEMQLLDATRRKFLNFTQQQKEAEIARLDDEIRRKVDLRETETRTAIDEAEIKNMELQAQRKMLEQEMFREFADSDQKTRNDLEFRRKQRDVENHINQSMAQEDREREMHHRRQLHQSLSQTQQVEGGAAARNQLEYRHRLDELDQERRLLQVSQLQEENKKLEEGLRDLMNEMDIRRARRGEESLAELSSQRVEAEAAESRRIGLLEHHMQDARTHLDRLNRNHTDMSERLRDLQSSIRDSHTETSQSERPLNDSDSEHSTQFSLDRGRQTFEEREREVMAEVRKLRQKLATENRHKRPPPAYSLD